MLKCVVASFINIVQMFTMDCTIFDILQAKRASETPYRQISELNFKLVMEISLKYTLKNQPIKHKCHELFSKLFYRQIFITTLAYC